MFSRCHILQEHFQIGHLHAPAGCAQHIQEKLLSFLRADVGGGLQQAQPKGGRDCAFGPREGPEIIPGHARAEFPILRWFFLTRIF